MKNNKFTILAFVLVTTSIVISLISQPSARIIESQISYPVPDTQFIIGAFHDGIDTIYDNTRTQLKFNTWHHYVRDSGWGWVNVAGDYYSNPNINEYGNGVMYRIDKNNNEHGMRTFMDRPIIQYLVGSQRVDYKCESVGNSYSNDRYYYYSYDTSLIVMNNANYSVNDINDNINGTVEVVKHCHLIDNSKSNNDILIDCGLRANREMSFNSVNYWMRDTAYEWYVLPRIKIDPIYAADQSHNNDVVARIVVTGWKGEVEKEFALRVINFKSQSGSYDGRYLQSFKLNSSDTVDYFQIERDSMHNFTNPNPEAFIFDWETPENQSLCDIKIYWTGKCDMWIDRIRIENRPAHEFLTLNINRWTNKLNNEIDWAKRNDNTIKQIPNYFYFEECAFSHFPAIKEINKRIRERTNNNNEIVIWLNYDLVNVHVPHYDQHWFTAEQLHRYLNEDFGLNNIVMGSYALEGWPVNDSRVSYHPNTLSSAGYSKENMVLSYPVNPSIYENTLQDKLDYKVGGTGLIYIYSLMDRLAKTGMKVICCPQAHSWWGEFHRLKEPTNEELELQACLALSYNAKGIIYFCYNSFDDNINDVYARGIVNTNGSQRTASAYGQNKFGGIRDIDIKLNKWGPYILKFINDSTRTCIYRIDTSRVNFISNTYFREIKTELQNPNSQCTELIRNSTFENVSNRYIQATVFKNPSENYSKYFMLLNRRCTPGDDDCSGRRFVTIVLDSLSSEFAGFNNWKIIDLMNDSLITTFDTRKSNSISLGKYKPAEGKLYKIIPVMIDGGTFVCDEVVTATTFNCNGIVNTGGYNLNIPATNGLTTISFAQNGTIQGNNGTDFIIRGYNQIVLQGQNGNKWRGLTINNCANINIHNTKFKDIGDIVPSSFWALSLYNSPSVEISNCFFDLPPQAKGINVNNFGISDYSDVAIMNNNISTDNSTAAIFVGTSALGFCNLFLMDNVVTNGSTQSTFGILLLNVYSSYADRNTITGFEFGIELMTSTLEMSDNIISSTGGNNTGILATSSSTINMGLIGNYYFGGNNTFSNSGVNSKNISLSNSVFEMNYGNNNLTVDNTSGCFNLVGNGNFTTSGDGPIKFVEAIGNCFNGEGNNAIDSITDLEGLRYTLKEDPHNCNIQQDRIADFTAPVINNIVDTVYRTTLPQYQISSPSVALYRDFYKSLMKRNYDSTKIFGTQLLTNYSDSITTADVISLLYFANTKLADISANMLTLKTFLEQLIINHPQNLTLVRTANYFVQKCKVHLQQFTSALDGYQDIIVQNPYSYEGLVASWDYASTLLLANSGGAYSNNEDESLNSLVLESQFLVDSLRMKRLMNTDKYDKKVFTQDDRKVLIKSVGDVLKDERQKQIEKVKSLEEELNKSKGNNTSKVKQKLEEVKNLNSLIKTKRPKDAEEYKVIINNDIEKLYPKKTSGDSNPQITVPQTYALYQNYPNPFNPTTKIAYDIPHDAKVKLVIYDILGREMKTLVNNEYKTAGKYITEFNGSNLASGIYFARILVNEGKDFMAVKKMVLVK